MSTPIERVIWRGGTRIIESPYLTEPGEPVSVRRTWRERWLTRPWRPFRRTRLITPQVPSRQVFQLPDGTMLMHPVTRAHLRQVLEQEEPSS